MKKTCDSGITAVFQVTNVSSRSDIHPEVSENRYYGILDDILECDFKSFRLILFIVLWYRLRLNENVPERTIIEHDNVFTMVNTRLIKRARNEPYVLLSQCEQVFYSEVPGKPGWSFVVRHDPRGRSIKYNVVEEKDTKELEDDVDDDQDQQLVDDVPDEDVEEEELDHDDEGVNVHQDYIHVDDDIIKTDINDDDDDMTNP